MPLFLLPYLFMQLAVSGGTNAWKMQSTADLDEPNIVHRSHRATTSPRCCADR